MDNAGFPDDSPSASTMAELLFPLIGGLGLFLIGMMLLSEGLIAFGGGVMKQALARFTGTPRMAFVSGTLATVIVQSSTATTVTLIGFVSAGLISFSQAIGVLIGASLGNTATGWIVATLGLKVNLGFYTLPLVGIGALMKMLGKGKPAQLGVAIAGFGMIFVGLDTLQQGMRGLSAVIDLAGLPSGGFGALLIAMLAGFVLTAILQSSTAAIATTLTALHTQAVNFEQAAALVVGAAIGTTLTGALVTIGGTIYAKRTALAYILFNLVSGLLAIALLPIFLWMIGWLVRHAGLDAGATSLAAFHTLFIAVGVALFLPWVASFARLVERLLPQRVVNETQTLDDSMLSIPSVALEASQRALEQISTGLLSVYRGMLSGKTAEGDADRLDQTRRSLDQTYAFVSRIAVETTDSASTAQRIAQLHAIDHLLRFHGRLADLRHSQVKLTDASYEWALEHSRQILDLACKGMTSHDLSQHLPTIELNALTLTTLSRNERHQVLDSPSISESAQVLARTDTFRWLERTAHHIWRICHYLAQGRNGVEVRPDAEEPPRPPGAA